MLISDSKKFLFYHTYKVAGTSIRSTLRPYARRGQPPIQALNYLAGVVGFRLNLPPIYYYHPKLSNVRDYLGDDFYSYYRFCFVREPLEWQKSLYFFSKKNRRHHQHSIIKKLTFDEYLNWRIDSDLKLESNLIYDGNELLVNRVGRFERIDSDFRDICLELGIAYDLGHLNTAGKGKSISIKSKTFDRFKKAFELDYEKLGYNLSEVNVDIIN